MGRRQRAALLIAAPRLDRCEERRRTDAVRREVASVAELRLLAEEARQLLDHVARLADENGAHEPLVTLILTGVVVASLLGAAISLLKYLADPYNQLPAITFWLMGSFSSASQQELASLFPAVAFALAVLLALAWRINLLALPEDEARALGVNTRRLRAIVIAAATLATSASVAVSGIIGWVGLVVPHMARLVVGPEFSRLLPIAAVFGAIFMLLIDTLARTLATIEVPPGILTAVVGTPVFIALLARARRMF